MILETDPYKPAEGDDDLFADPTDDTHELDEPFSYQKVRVAYKSAAFISISLFAVLLHYLCF